MSLARPALAPAGRSPRSLLGAAAMAVVAVGAAFAASRWPVLAIGGAVAVLAVGVVLSRLLLAASLLAASFFFTNYLNSGVGLLTPDKAIGGIALLAWALEWGTGARRVVVVRHMWPLLGLALWIGVSITVARDDQAALTTTVRYLLFFILFFLTVQTIRGDRRRAEAMATVVVAAAAVAGFIGLVEFFGHHVQRARGPLSDPNDFGFLLGSTVPLAVYRLRWSATRAGRVACAVALVVTFAAILATFSRSALLGLAAAGAWSVATRRIKLRWGVAALACLAAIALVGLAVEPQVVRSAFGEKAAIADTNVSTRLLLWRVALQEFSSAPVTGVGPGNYERRFQEFAATPSPDLATFTTHNAYLNVLAELGLPGFFLFVGFLAMSWASLRRRFPSRPQADSLQGALAAGFLVAAVGSMFLTEQFYPPLWFLSALGVSLAAGPEAAGPQA
jgi:putative inorganic carbon (HCO3(-)) transporter